MSGDRPGTEPGQRPDERRVTRRQWIRGVGGGVAGAAALTTAGTASAAPVEEFADAKPESATITHDSAWLKRYRPVLDLRAVPHDNRPTLYGWKVSSRDADVETDVGVFACEYALQRSWLTLTSHAGDHEWIYVYVDRNSGEVTEVSYAAYHWLRGYVTNPSVDGSDGGDHPMMTVAPTYHHYAPVSSSSSGVLLDPQSLGDYDTRSGALYQWLANGLDTDMAVGAVHNPWLLDSNGPLDAWWSRSGSGRWNRFIVDAWALAAFGFGVGIRGAEDADFGDAGGPS